ncbi:MAG: hypothetical protein DME97_02425 [Verrucomicrobia bacterium]|nr:MAG: hypothetical protein DME97_02425 [Verrucomicrobiota bacterium]
MDVTVFRQSTKQQLGPFPAQIVREMLARGELSSDDLIYYQGLTAWAPISTLPSTDLSPSTQPPATPALRPATVAAPAPATLEARVAALEVRLAQSSLHSPKFWSRAFTVLGHHLSAILAIYAVLFVLGLIFLLFAALIGKLAH